jgi:Pyridoxamine 5'-phosphate oxidase
VWIDQRGSEILGQAECLRLLALGAKEDGVGRLAVSRADAPIVQPVNFTYHEHQILIRLGEGFMADAAHGALVAFEVDRFDQGASVAWSVLVRGLATVVAEEDATALAEAAPRPVVPTPGLILLSIRPDAVTGRRFPVTGAVAPSPPPDPAPRSEP